MKLRRLPELLHRLEDGLLVCTFALMLLLGGLQILLRNLFDMGLVWSDPLLRALVLWLTLQGAMIATRDGRHLRIDLLSRYLRRSKGRVAMLTSLVSAGVCALMVPAGVRLVTLEYADGTSLAGGVPTWAVQCIIPLAFAVMALRFLLLACRPPGPEEEAGGPEA